MRAKVLLFLFACCLSQVVPAQTREQLGSSYFAYPEPPALAKAPKGLTPVYLSHYGRHGSRWLTEDARYERVLAEFQSNALTDYGKDVLRRLNVVWQDAKGRSGDLTHVGERQHQAIAQRMCRNFPNILKKNARVKAQSSTSRRCMMSMMAAAEGIKECVPSITIVRSAHERDMDTINHESQELIAFKKSDLWKQTEASVYVEYTHYERLMSRLFAHPDEVKDPKALWDGLYWIASDMQNVELGELSFYDLFTDDELKDYWTAVNYRMYVTNGPASLNGGAMAASSKNLLQAIAQDADNALNGGMYKANLRYGHDSALLRLLTLMQIVECKQAPDDADARSVAAHWHDYELVPMAANLQMVFYRDKSGGVFVRFLLNEREVHLPLEAFHGAYYKWDEVKRLWNK